MTATQERISRHWLLYALWIALFIALFWRPLTALAHFGLGNDDASHILLIPFISAWLLFQERKETFRRVSYDLAPGAMILLFAGAGLGWTLKFSNGGSLTGFALALALFWIAGFALIFGRNALREGRFALLFLLFMVPLPQALADRVIYLLQKGSAELSAGIFDLVGVPVLREGFVFHLPRVSIEVARECSGIRSSIALIILSLLAVHFYLRTFWKQAVFVVCGLLMMLVKNAIRIVTLTLLAVYVDSDFLYGRLHHHGGVVFFVVSLLLLVPIFWLLERSEAELERQPVVATQTSS